VGETMQTLERSATMHKYSDFFKTLHDEQKPTGYLGRGTHYSVLRAVVWHGHNGKTLPEAHYLDFAVVWDEDHDIRVITVLEMLYKRAWLSAGIIFGERKAQFTFLTPDAVYASMTEEERSTFAAKLDDFTQTLEGDCWYGHLHPVSSDEHKIIQDDRSRTSLYLQTIHMLWELGLKPIASVTSP